MPTRIMIADSNQEKRDRLREVISEYPNCEVMSSARDGQEALQLAVQFHPDIALIAWDLPGVSGEKTCEIMNALYPDIMSVLMLEHGSQAVAESAMYSGARALITKDIKPRLLLDLVDNLSELRARRTSPEYLEWKDARTHPRVISITGAKGGVGKTTIAVNLACTLAKRAPGKVALIDLHSQFGDVPTMMNIHPERTMLDLMPLVGEGELDTEMMHSYVAKHPSGVDVLITSVKPAALDGLSTDCLDNILYVLKRSYRYIVMDVPAMLQTITVHALAHSNVVFLIANLFDLTTASDTMKLADALEEDSIPRENISIVINRVSKSNQIQSKDIIKVFRGRALAFIPNDSRLVTTINQGTPLALSGGDSPWKQCIEELADLASGTEPSTAKETEDKPNPNLRWWRANGTA